MFELNDLTMYLPNVKIVGVGEGGCNFLKRISSMGIPNVTLVAKNNDDIKELVQNNKMKGGKEGEAKEDILNVLHDEDLVFVLTSIGSDNDSEAASMVASCAKEEIKALTVAIVDISSYCGGAEHRQQTEISLQKIKDSADAVAVISNEHIHAEENKGGSNFETIDQLIYQGVQSIISLISDEGIVNIDFVDVRTMLQNAGKIAEFLSSHPKVEDVSYPGLKTSQYYELAKKYFPKGPGAIMSIRIKGGREEALRTLEKVRIFDYMTNVGDAKSLIVHPESSTHFGHSPEENAKAGVYPNTLRLSVGIEDPEDLIADLDQALS